MQYSRKRYLEYSKGVAFVAMGLLADGSVIPGSRKSCGFYKLG